MADVDVILPVGALFFDEFAMIGLLDAAGVWAVLV